MRKQNTESNRVLKCKKVRAVRRMQNVGYWIVGFA